VGTTDFRVRPVTVSLGRGRTARGFLGWAAYRAYETSMLKEMWLALSAAADFGVGDSRSLGFGAVRITPTGRAPAQRHADGVSSNTNV
jgi:CRISPR/Cas system endoribonuclease Cas6 (RAMP superfamily)